MTSTRTGTGRHESEHLFHTASDLGRAQMRHLEDLLDESTTALLSATDPQPGSRCLEVGAGGGSIARWMAERAGPAGEVVAVDLDTDHLVIAPGVQIHQHDITEGPPVEGEFDLIHARLVMLHLPQRLEVLSTLVDALAPGGWLVIEDFGMPLPRMIPTQEADEFAIFDRLIEVGHGVVGPAAGQSLRWAHEVADHMDTHGLVDVHQRQRSQVVRGSDTAARYLHNLMTQIAPHLAAGGMSQDELRRCGEVLMDPRFRAWFYLLVGTRGRKPGRR